MISKTIKHYHVFVIHNKILGSINLLDMFNISFQELCMLINNLQNVWSSAIVIHHRLLAMTSTNRMRRKNILHLMNESNVLRSMIKKEEER